MTHGLTDAQFLDLVASFLGPYYIALAAMNGLAALYLWRSGQLNTWFSLPVPFVGKRFEVTNALVWLLFGTAFVLLAAIAGGGMTAWTSLPESWRIAINQST